MKITKLMLRLTGSTLLLTVSGSKYAEDIFKFARMAVDPKVRDSRCVNFVWYMILTPGYNV